MKRIYTYFILSLILMTSCQKEVNKPVEGGFNRDYIHFFMRDVQYGDPSTKAIIENTETLKNLGLSMYVVDRFNITAPFNGSVGMEWDSSSSLWPAKNNRGNSVAWEGKEYSFYSWILSAGDGTVTPSKLVRPGDKVTITQPSSYVHEDSHWADFLMSYIVAANGSAKPLVEFELERVTAGVEVYVFTPLDGVKINSISIDNVVNSAVFNLDNQDNANSGRVGIRNNWRVTNASGSATYNRENVDVSKRNSEDVFDSKFLVMRFVTIPQAIASTLTISYTSNSVDYEESFDLSKVSSIKRWNRGRKTRYYINIDTSVGLEAKIAEWISVDFIEGTFLPWLPDEE